MAVGRALAGWGVMAHHYKVHHKSGGVEYTVETATSADGVVVTVNGEMFGVTLDVTGVGEGVLYSGDQALPYFICKKESQFHIWLSGKSYVLEVVSNQPHRGAAVAAVGNEIKAPMPGTVLKINVKAGDTVEANAPIVIMESMKMEMTLAVPAAVKIKEVLCKESQLVEVGAVLVKIEPLQTDQAGA